MFSQKKKKKKFLSWENGTLIFREMKLFGRKIKKFQEGNFRACKIKIKPLKNFLIFPKIT